MSESHPLKKLFVGGIWAGIILAFGFWLWAPEPTTTFLTSFTGRQISATAEGVGDVLDLEDFQFERGTGDSTPTQLEPSGASLPSCEHALSVGCDR